MCSVLVGDPGCVVLAKVEVDAGIEDAEPLATVVTTDQLIGKSQAECFEALMTGWHGGGCK